MHRYIIQAHTNGTRFRITGTRLPYPQWHTREEFAISFAYWLCRDIECASIWILDSTGYPIIAETVRGEPPRFLGA